MLSRKSRATVLALGVVAAFSCSVFPDQATLPPHGTLADGAFGPGGAGGDGSAGEPSSTHAGAGGTPVSVAPQAGDGPGAGAAAGEGGALSSGGAPDNLGGASGEGPGGAAGAGGAAPATCVNHQQQLATIDADTWIEASKPNTGHGNDAQLFVVGGSAERRALLALTLPASPAGKVLNRARLTLVLDSNADVSLAARRLGLHELTQSVSEQQTTWINYDKGGSHKWTLPGADFGAEIAAATLRAGTASGSVTFEVTVPIRKIIGAVAIPLSVIVLEKGAPPAAPAELAFTSREGDALKAPALLLDYCDP